VAVVGDVGAGDALVGDALVRDALVDGDERGELPSSRLDEMTTAPITITTVRTPPIT
jgi:hypothetical protein